MYFAPVRWLTLCAVAVLTVVGCADSSIHDEQAVKQAFAEQGYDLRPLFDNGPLVPRGSSTEFAVIVAGSSDEAERFFAPLEDRSSTTYDVRDRNVIVTADERPAPADVRRIEAALDSLRSS